MALVLCNLRAALDSSPLWGAAKLEDTYNLLGHALRKALRLLALAEGQSVEEMAHETRAEVVTGSSLKAALDLNWEDPTECSLALEVILKALDAIESQVQKKTEDDCLLPARVTKDVAREIQAQNVTFDFSWQTDISQRSRQRPSYCD